MISFADLAYIRGAHPFRAGYQRVAYCSAGSSEAKVFYVPTECIRLVNGSSCSEDARQYIAEKTGSTVTEVAFM